MIIRSLLYSVGVYILTAIVALLVVGVILLIYKIVHRGGNNKDKKVDSKQASQVAGKEG